MWHVKDVVASRAVRTAGAVAGIAALVLVTLGTGTMMVPPPPPSEQEALDAIARARADLDIAQAYIESASAPPGVVLTCTVLDEDRVRVDWTAADEPVGWLTHRDGVDDFGTGPWTSAILPPEARVFVFSSLLPGTPYTFGLAPGGATCTATTPGTGGPLPTTTPLPTTEPSPPPGACPTETMAAALRLGTPRFVDEFDRTTMGPNWSLYDSVGHNGNGTRDPEAFTVDGTRARITGTVDGSSGGAALLGQPMFRDHIETCMRASAGDGAYHPVLLLWPDAEDWPAGGEVDYAEIFSANRVGVNFFLHFGADNSQTSTGEPGVDAGVWHNYGVEWTAECIRGYIDGHLFFTDCNAGHLPPRAMHATMQLDAFDGDSGYVVSTMDVESLRIWDGA